MIRPANHHSFCLQNVSVRYGSITALDSVSLAISSGELVGFVGPSGAGKTTLLRLLNGTVRATDGCVTAHKQMISDLSAKQLRQLRTQIGFIHQDLSLVPNLRVIQNVQCGRLGSRSLLDSLQSILFTSRTEAGEIHDLLNRVGIADKLYERTDRLSGGQQQRVAIARALFQQPVALLADEPVSSVDPARARDTMTMLTQIAREQKLTLCVSMHNIHLAREFLPRLVGLRDGRIMFSRPTDQIDDATFAALYELVGRPSQVAVNA